MRTRRRGSCTRGAGSAGRIPSFARAGHARAQERRLGRQARTASWTPGTCCEGIGDKTGKSQAAEGATYAKAVGNLIASEDRRLQLSHLLFPRSASSFFSFFIFVILARASLSAGILSPSRCRFRSSAVRRAEGSFLIWLNLQQSVDARMRGCENQHKTR